jgi:hypothetical protein
MSLILKQILIAISIELYTYRHVVQLPQLGGYQLLVTPKYTIYLHYAPQQA